MKNKSVNKIQAAEIRCIHGRNRLDKIEEWHTDGIKHVFSKCKNTYKITERMFNTLEQNYDGPQKPELRDQPKGNTNYVKIIQKLAMKSELTSALSVEYRR